MSDQERYEQHVQMEHEAHRASKDESHWNLMPWRIAELREQADRLRGTLNMHEVKCLRDLLNGSLPVETAEIERLRGLWQGQSEYAIQLQRLIERFCAGDALPYPELHHHRLLAAKGLPSETGAGTCGNCGTELEPVSCSYCGHTAAERTPADGCKVCDGPMPTLPHWAGPVCEKCADKRDRDICPMCDQRLSDKPFDCPECRHRFMLESAPTQAAVIRDNGDAP